MSTSFSVGQRRSFDGALCTIRYVGKVKGTTGEWLGVEWDDPTRGKHTGEHGRVRYFTCRSKQPTAGSFIRPSRQADKHRRFLEALHEKYASEFEEELALQQQRLSPGSTGAVASLHDSIEISGKVVEEVGFDKIRKRLAELQELKIVLLDGLRIAGVLAYDGSLDEREQAREEIARTCPKIKELDLSRNLLSRWSDVADICGQLKHLRFLKLNGNRLGPVEEGLRFEGITELHLDQTLLNWDEIAAVACQFPSLTSLSASTNQISTISAPLSDTITRLSLEHNEITSLSSIRHLTALSRLKHLSLRGNYISTAYDADGKNDTSIRFSNTLTSVDLSLNQINSWLFINTLPAVFPGLQTLRMSGNPLYDQPVAPSSVTNLPEKPMTVDEAFMLTLSRLSSLQMLNYSKISGHDRNNGELYYLSLIGKELSASPLAAEPGILATHPRYRELCEKYGEPSIARATDTTGLGGTVNPRSVAARLVRMAFYLSSPSPSASRLPEDTIQTNKQQTEEKEEVTKIKEIPRSFDTYQVKAIVSRLFELSPYIFKLVWETDELDPVNKTNMDEDEWDSSEDEGDDGLEEDSRGGKDSLPVEDKKNNTNKLVKREVELVDSTRDIGFWFPGDLKEARIRIEVPG